MSSHPYSHITNDPSYFDLQADRLLRWANQTADPVMRAAHEADAAKARAAAEVIRKANAAVPA